MIRSRHQHFIYLLFFLNFICVFGPVAASEHAELIENYGKVENRSELGNEVFIDRLYFFRDESQNLEIKHVLNSTTIKWNSVQPQWLTFGVTTDPYWIKIDLPSSQLKRERLLEVANHFVDNIKFYLVENVNGVETLTGTMELGAFLPVDQRPLSSTNYLFPFKIPAETDVSIYLKVNSTTPLRLPIYLWNQESFSKVTHVRSIIEGGYLGVAIIMMLYNLCIAFLTRDSSYFFYSAMIIGLAGSIAVEKGLALNYLWPNSPGIDFQIVVMLVAFSCAASIPFTIKFLSLEQNAPKFLLWFKAILVVWGLIFISAIFLPTDWVLVAIAIVALPGGTSLAVVGVHTWRKGVPAAKFYTIAWLSFIASTGVYNFYVMGIYPMNTFTEYSLQVGSFVEIALLSLGLAWRIKYLDEEKQKATFSTKAKSEFLAAMSHEIRTPMNGILGMAEILKDTKLSAQQSTYLNTILGSGKTLLTVLNEILDYSKIEAGKVELENIQFSIRNLIDETTSVFSVRALEKGLFYNVYISAEVPAAISGDPTRVSQVINNFISNAFKFTAKGRVTVHVSRTEENRLLVRVEDSGIGIPNEKLDTVFENFTQVEASTTRQYGGTGLGLPISKKFIEMMGGEIGVESIPNEGSAFWFEIPLKNEVPFSPVENSVDRKRIMVISPDEYFYRQFKEYQHNWNFDCTLFSSIENCLSNIEDEEITFDHVIIDQYCPDYSEEVVLSELYTKPWANDSKFVFLLKVGSSRIELDKLSPTPIYEEYPISVTRLQLLICNTNDMKRDVLSDAAGSSVYEGMNILVADDNQVNRMVVTGYLKRLGITPILKSNGKEVLEAVCQRSTKFDLILMDCEMPEMDGFEATKRIRQWERDHQKDSSIRICALSAHVMKEYQQKCMNAGMNDYLSKPIVYEDLRALLGRIRNYEVSSSVAVK